MGRWHSDYGVLARRTLTSHLWCACNSHWYRHLQFPLYLCSEQRPRQVTFTWLLRDKAQVTAECPPCCCPTTLYQYKTFLICQTCQSSKKRSAHGDHLRLKDGGSTFLVQPRFKEYIPISDPLCNWSQFKLQRCFSILVSAFIANLSVDVNKLSYYI